MTYHLTPFQIIEIFETYTLCPARDYSNWSQFKTIVPLITNPTNLKCPSHEKMGLSGFKMSKSELPVQLNNVALVSIGRYYPTIMLSWCDKFTIENFRGMYGALYEARLLAKRLKKADVVNSIKVFYNMIFGQLSDGPIRHLLNGNSDLAKTASKVTETIYNHPACHHANIDEFTVDQSKLNEFLIHMINVLYQYGFSADQIDVELIKTVTISKRYNTHKAMKATILL